MVMRIDICRMRQHQPKDTHAYDREGQHAAPCCMQPQAQVLNDLERSHQGDSVHGVEARKKRKAPHRKQLRRARRARGTREAQISSTPNAQVTVSRPKPPPFQQQRLLTAPSIAHMIPTVAMHDATSGMSD